MGIADEEVRRIARLSNLEYPQIQDEAGIWVEPPDPLLSDTQCHKLAVELGKVLEHVERLQEVDISGVEPSSHGVPLPTRFRTDEPQEPIESERVLSGAPLRVGNAFSVPKIIE